MNVYNFLSCSSTYDSASLHVKKVKVRTIPDMFEYKCLLGMLPLLHDVVLPGIKLSYLVSIKKRCMLNANNSIHIKCFIFKAAFL